jgi:hypothetical protein
MERPNGLFSKAIFLNIFNEVVCPVVKLRWSYGETRMKRWSRYSTSGRRMGFESLQRLLRRIVRHILDSTFSVLALPASEEQSFEGLGRGWVKV